MAPYIVFCEICFNTFDRDNKLSELATIPY
jgi:hypothetical protein